MHIYIYILNKVKYKCIYVNAHMSKDAHISKDYLYNHKLINIISLISTQKFYFYIKVYSYPPSNFLT